MSKNPLLSGVYYLRLPDRRSVRAKVIRRRFCLYLMEYEIRRSGVLYKMTRWARKGRLYEYKG